MKFTLKKWTQDRAEYALGEIVEALGPVTVLMMLVNIIDSYAPRVLGIVAEAAFAVGRVMAELLPVSEQGSTLQAIDDARDEFYREHE